MKKTMMAGAAMSLALAAMATAPVAAAQEEDRVEETIIVTGTRRGQRSAADSPAPVDVISPSELTNQADNDIQNILRTSVPSFNVNTQPISDAATLVRPANLRGLSPDNTLVLVNGKRLHRAAVIAFLGGGISDGAQGPDISTIPAIGLKQVEVLRDGASSQYGSDAIAGVINFILKDDAEGGAVEVKYGETYESDGENYQIAANIGLPLGEQGFLNLSGEYQETEATSRSVQRDDAAGLIAAGNTAVANPAQIWGQPEVRGDFKLFANSAFELNENHELYAFGSYAERETEGGFFFRNPTNRGGVYAGPTVDPATGALLDAADGGVASVLVGDLSIEDTGDCPAGIPLTGTDGVIPDAAILAQVVADANCFSFVEQFPGGFTPSFGGELEDMSIALGIRGEFAIGNGLTYDASYKFGENDISFFINNTINASLGPNTPTSFNPGGYTQTENLFNLDFGYALPVEGMASDLNVAFGYEYREEEFEVTAGDPASFQIGPLATPGGAYPLGQGFSSSSNGFGGFTPASAGKNSQSNNSFYIDLEGDVTEALTLQAAVRYEDYDVFGETTNYKIGGLWRVNDNFRLRSTFSTGFHAPTVGQANVVNISTVFVGTVLSDEGTFPLNSAAGQTVADFIESQGNPRPTLTPEESENFTIGAAFDVADFTVTVDYFNIALDDRISRSSSQPFAPALEFLAEQNGVVLQDGLSTSQIINALDNAGVINSADFAGAEDLTAFAFFNNAFDTETQGLDIVATGPLEFGQTGDTDLAIAINYTDTSVERVDNTISAGRVRQLEDNLPDWRGSASVTHTQGKWRGLGRINYFGEFFEDHLDANLAFPIEGDSEITFDAELGYMLTDGLELIVGARNLFDSYPTENPFSGVVGAQYPSTAPNGFNGGQWYLKARYNW
ncbi:MAG: TonB-dependent receptor [Pseudomonadota bacterium]